VNGPSTKEWRAATPVSVEELAPDATACVAAGARAIHLHPRDGEGHEWLDDRVIDAVVDKVQDACGVPVGVSTGAWIEPNPARRLAPVQTWRAPDYASVTLSEASVGVKAGIWSVEDANRLAATGLGQKVKGLLIEPVEVSGASALSVSEDIHHALNRLGHTAPRLQRGDGEATWVLLTAARRRGIDSRTGLEDTVCEPKGELTTGNAALVRSAGRLGVNSVH